MKGTSISIAICSALGSILLTGRSTEAQQMQNDTCSCQADPPPDLLQLGGIYDASTYPWVPELLQFTTERLNNGWQDILPSSLEIDLDFESSKCDATTAARAYWKLRNEAQGGRLDGVIAAYCSGASIAVARIAGLEGIPQISPASSSSQLSNDEEFPYFSRLLAPDDYRGEVAAVVALLRAFDWERVNLVVTDTGYAKAWATSFRKLWVGEHDDGSGTWTGKVTYSGTIGMQLGTGQIDDNSVSSLLEEIPTTTNPNSRIVLLVANKNNAYDILQVGRNIMPSDTVWFGTYGWIGQEAAEEYWPALAGTVGIGSFRNQNDFAQSFLNGFRQWQRWQRSKGVNETWDRLPDFAGEVVDSVTAMTRGLVQAGTARRQDGDFVTDAIRELNFSGVSGNVEFTDVGDRKNPLYSIFNFQYPDWVQIGTIGTAIGSEQFLDEDNLCIGIFGCGLENIPSDSFPVEEEKLPIWVAVVVALLGVIVVLVVAKYWRSRRSKRRIKAELDAFRDSIVGMRAAESNYIPRLPNRSAPQLQEAHLAAVAPTEKVQWCWRETEGFMDRHDPEKIVGDPMDCWVKYDDDSNAELEAAFQEQGRKGTFSPMQGYTVNFETMMQTKIATSFQRDVQRLVENSEDVERFDSSMVMKDTKQGDSIPDELWCEPQMVLIEGDVVQVSTQRQDGWAFGTKLHHADEAASRALVDLVLSTSTKTQETESKTDDDERVLTDTGWFQLDVTRMPSADELQALQANVGDAAALEAPDFWEPVDDPTIVKKVKLKKDDKEYIDVVKNFRSSLYGAQSTKAKIINVFRIQNLAMYQSYVIKRQTICYRETGIQDGKDANEDAIRRKAMERFERRWLWHGTSWDTMDKILQQGFNRSFCGKNATMYGKGVYFARDAGYSATKAYSVPDAKGHQFMIACRVMVGEYCRGRKDALTPDVRDPKNHSLYDSTVGLLTNDTMANPSIYVTYHDAQAYPEYLIEFAQ